MKRIFCSFLLILCAACATPQVQPCAPVAHAPKLAPHIFVAEDKTSLPLRHWLPHAKPKAVIIALHGFNDYSNAFVLPGEYLSKHGIAVYAYDQRGFGAAPHPGIWPGKENLTRDAADMVRAVKKRYPHVPVYLLGESMGGAVAIAAAARPDFPEIDGIILSAPALWGGETMNPFFRISLWSLAHAWPGKMLTGQDLHILASDNITMLRALSADPLIIKATRVDAVYGLVRLMDTAYDDIGKVKVPMLILYGAHDQVIPPAPIAGGIRKVTVVMKAGYYPRGYHMLLRDTHGNIPADDIIAWIGDREQPLPSGSETRMQKFLSHFLPERFYHSPSRNSHAS